MTEETGHDFEGIEQNGKFEGRFLLLSHYLSSFLLVCTMPRSKKEPFFRLRNGLWFRTFLLFTPVPFWIAWFTQFTAKSTCEEVESLDKKLRSFAILWHVMLFILTDLYLSLVYMGVTRPRKTGSLFPISIILGWFAFLGITVNAYYVCGYYARPDCDFGMSLLPLFLTTICFLVYLMSVDYLLFLCEDRIAKTNV